jgi:hypothetical protein
MARALEEEAQGKREQAGAAGEYHVDQEGGTKAKQGGDTGWLACATTQEGERQSLASGVGGRNTENKPNVFPVVDQAPRC